MSSWGSTGGWIPNYYILIRKNACSSIRNLFGNSWLTMLNAFNVPAYRCPIPVVIMKTLKIMISFYNNHNGYTVFDDLDMVELI